MAAFSIDLKVYAKAIMKINKIICQEMIRNVQINANCESTSASDDKSYLVFPNISYTHILYF